MKRDRLRIRYSFSKTWLLLFRHFGRATRSPSFLGALKPFLPSRKSRNAVDLELSECLQPLQHRACDGRVVLQQVLRFRRIAIETEQFYLGHFPATHIEHCVENAPPGHDEFPGVIAYRDLFRPALRDVAEPIPYRCLLFLSHHIQDIDPVKPVRVLRCHSRDPLEGRIDIDHSHHPIDLAAAT